MILSFMAFLVVVSVVGAAAAFVGEAGLRRLGAPARLVWLGGMLLGPALLALEMFGSGQGAAAPAAAVIPSFELPPLIVGPGLGGWPGGLVATLAVGVWAALGLTLLAVLVRTHRSLARERGAWEGRRLMDWDVFLSANRGPAVAGLLRPWIVLPGWVLELPRAELRMVLIHEDEHVHSRDPLLLAVGLGLVVLTAWNPVTWWQLRRLRLAMELDCDRRVLRRSPDRRVYGASLISVAARAPGPSLGLAAFSERPSTIQQRIVAMTAKTTRWTGMGGALLVLLAALIGVQACGVDGPLSPEADVTAPAESPTANVTATHLTPEPTFTPYTIRPEIQNRDEVVQAMNDEYPTLLRDAGIGGDVIVWFFINAEGEVQDARVATGSGHVQLDAAALKVASVYRFTPAENEGEPTPVWVRFGISFQVR